MLDPVWPERSHRRRSKVWAEYLIDITKRVRFRTRHIRFREQVHEGALQASNNNVSSVYAYAGHMRGLATAGPSFAPNKEGGPPQERSRSSVTHAFSSMTVHIRCPI